MLGGNIRVEVIDRRQNMIALVGDQPCPAIQSSVVWLFFFQVSGQVVTQVVSKLSERCQRCRFKKYTIANVGFELRGAEQVIEK